MRGLIALLLLAALPALAGAAIIGRDDRHRIAPRLCEEPAGAVGQILIGSGTRRGTGTASLMQLPGAQGRRVFVTAAHVVAKDGRLRVDPTSLQLLMHVREFGGARRCQLRQLRVQRLEALSLDPTRDWSTLLQDIAVFRLHEQVETLRRGAIAPLAALPEDCPERRLRLTLHHGDIPEPGRYAVQRCSLRDKPAGVRAPEGVLFHDCDTAPGSSGGLITCLSERGWLAIGVNVAAVDKGGRDFGPRLYNIAVPFTPDILRRMVAFAGR